MCDASAYLPHCRGPAAARSRGIGFRPPSSQQGGNGEAAARSSAKASGQETPEVVDAEGRGAEGGIKSGDLNKLVAELKRLAFM